MSVQPSTTYRLAMKRIEGFHTALHTGKLEEVTGQDLADITSGFPNLSQISVVASVTLHSFRLLRSTPTWLLTDIILL